ncbi:hypothetical protein WJX77_008897 [Trebouxia sp. C0004]
MKEHIDDGSASDDASISDDDLSYGDLVDGNEDAPMQSPAGCKMRDRLVLCMTHKFRMLQSTHHCQGLMNLSTIRLIQSLTSLAPSAVQQGRRTGQTS